MDDLEIDDIMEPKKKKLNSGRKGKRVERELAKILTKRFGDTFSRSVGSGNRGQQVASLPKHAKDTFSGDLVCPEDFKWVLECKGGYNDVDLNGAFEGGNATIDAFLEQAQFQADDCHRKPILLWKKDRKPWLAFVHTDDLPEEWESDYQMQYRKWTIVPLKLLLKQCDSYWRGVSKAGGK